MSYNLFKFKFNRNVSHEIYISARLNCTPLSIWPSLYTYNRGLHLYSIFISDFYFKTSKRLVRNLLNDLFDSCLIF